MNTMQTYMVSYFEALTTLQNSQISYKNKASDTTLDESERAAAAAVYLDLTHQMAFLTDCHNVFAHKYALNPPNQAVAERSRQLAKKLAADLADQQNAQTFPKIVVKFLGVWAKLDSPGAKTPAAATKNTTLLNSHST